MRLNPYVHGAVRATLAKREPLFDALRLGVIFRAVWSHEDQRHRFTTINKNRFNSVNQA